MSRQNKVNPGMYTQRGRLTQDDAAREIVKQREIGSEHTWQPVQRDQEPRLTSESAGEAEDAPIAAPDESAEKTPAPVTAKPGPAKPASAKKTAARKKAKATAKKTVRAKKTVVSAKRGKAKASRRSGRGAAAKRT